jgi:hypothetical protein
MSDSWINFEGTYSTASAGLTVVRVVLRLERHHGLMMHLELADVPAMGRGAVKPWERSDDSKDGGGRGAPYCQCR